MTEDDENKVIRAAGTDDADRKRTTSGEMLKKAIDTVKGRHPNVTVHDRGHLAWALTRENLQGSVECSVMADGAKTVRTIRAGNYNRDPARFDPTTDADAAALEACIEGALASPDLPQ